MKIMSFNTQHCNNYTENKIDYNIMAEAIRKCDADIIGLNEMRDKGEAEGYDAQTEILAQLTGISNRYFAKALDVGGVNPYGNAILSKIPFESTETIKIPDPQVRTGNRHYETRCILKAKLENGLTVLITHFGLNKDEQENAVETVLKVMEKEKCILMGDFNARPDNDVLNPIRECMKDVADYFKEPMLSFPSNNPYCKIDYIFVTLDIKVESADIPEIVASDHRPHTAQIDF